jgi:hypothetical protein
MDLRVDQVFGVHSESKGKLDSEHSDSFVGSVILS